MSPMRSPGQGTAGRRLSVSALLVAAGMFLSRIAGYARTVLFSAIFGVESTAADAFNQAFKIPNFLQNLLGEGALSASLIPVYSSLLEENDQARADRVARAVLGVLAVVTAVIVLAGLVWTGPLVSVLAPGFEGAKRELTIELVRILFPGIGLLVLSAWCLAVLNSHHRFFLSYVAPVLWNAAIIAALVIYRHAPQDVVAVRIAWAATVGAVLQLAVQVGPVWRLMAAHRTRTIEDVRETVRFVLLTSLPVIFTRGVVQVSAFVDSQIASLLPTGAVTALANATQLYQLPVSLFGSAVSSAALPSLSAAKARHGAGSLRDQLVTSQRMITVFVVPSMIAFIAFGDVMVGMLLQRGQFTRGDTLYVWGVLAGSSVGLVATTVGRLYTNAFYALGDTRTPTIFAATRVALAAGLGYLSAVVLPPAVGMASRWGAAGLTASAGLAGWVEFSLLRRTIQQRIGGLPASLGFLARTWAVAVAAAAAASALRLVFSLDHLILRGLVVLGAYGSLYLLLAHAAGLLVLKDFLRRVFRR
jgi:putative peptidoglycan lipid II flippase